MLPMNMVASRTFSSEDRLNRKRQAARIRQQRCRARKRAMAAAQLAAAKDQQVTRVIVDDEAIQSKRKTLTKTNTTNSCATTTHMDIPEMPVFKPCHVPPPAIPRDGHQTQTTVDGVKMSKRAAVHAALLDEHNRKFFARVEAERKTGRKDEKRKEPKECPAFSHMVEKNSVQGGQHQNTAATPTKLHSPMHSYYRHPPYPYYPCHPAYGPRAPHGKYSAPPLPTAYPHSPPFYRAYDGRYHPIPPHAMAHPRHFPARAPTQHSMTEPISSSAATSLPAVVSHSVSDDDRSTPSPELSPTSASDEEDSSLETMEQEAISAMLSLSNASLDEEQPAATALGLNFRSNLSS